MAQSGLFVYDNPHSDKAELVRIGCFEQSSLSSYSLAATFHVAHDADDSKSQGAFREQASARITLASSLASRPLVLAASSVNFYEWGYQVPFICYLINEPGIGSVLVCSIIDRSENRVLEWARVALEEQIVLSVRVADEGPCIAALTLESLFSIVHDPSTGVSSVTSRSLLSLLSRPPSIPSTSQSSTPFRPVNPRACTNQRILSTLVISPSHLQSPLFLILGSCAVSEGGRECLWALVAPVTSPSKEATNPTAERVTLASDESTSPSAESMYTLTLPADTWAEHVTSAALVDLPSTSPASAPASAVSTVGVVFGCVGGELLTFTAYVCLHPASSLPLSPSYCAALIGATRVPCIRFPSPRDAFTSTTTTNAATTNAATAADEEEANYPAITSLSCLSTVRSRSEPRVGVVSSSLDSCTFTLAMTQGYLPVLPSVSATSPIARLVVITFSPSASMLSSIASTSSSSPSLSSSSSSAIASSAPMLLSSHVSPASLSQCTLPLPLRMSSPLFGVRRLLSLTRSSFSTLSADTSLSIPSSAFWTVSPSSSSSMPSTLACLPSDSSSLGCAPIGCVLAVHVTYPVNAVSQWNGASGLALLMLKAHEEGMSSSNSAVVSISSGDSRLVRSPLFSFFADHPVLSPSQPSSTLPACAASPLTELNVPLPGPVEGEAASPSLLLFLASLRVRAALGCRQAQQAHETLLTRQAICVRSLRLLYRMTSALAPSYLAHPHVIPLEGLEAYSPARLLDQAASASASASRPEQLTRAPGVPVPSAAAALAVLGLAPRPVPSPPPSSTPSSSANVHGGGMGSADAMNATTTSSSRFPSSAVLVLPPFTWSDTETSSSSCSPSSASTSPLAPYSRSSDLTEAEARALARGLVTLVRSNEQDSSRPSFSTASPSSTSRDASVFTTSLLCRSIHATYSRAMMMWSVSVLVSNPRDSNVIYTGISLLATAQGVLCRDRSLTATGSLPPTPTSARSSSVPTLVPGTCALVTLDMAWDWTGMNERSTVELDLALVSSARSMKPHATCAGPSLARASMQGEEGYGGFATSSGDPLDDVDVDADIDYYEQYADQSPATVLPPVEVARMLLPSQPVDGVYVTASLVPSSLERRPAVRCFCGDGCATSPSTSSTSSSSSSSSVPCQRCMRRIDGEGILVSAPIPLPSSSSSSPSLLPSSSPAQPSSSQQTLHAPAAFASQLRASARQTSVLLELTRVLHQLGLRRAMTSTGSAVGVADASSTYDEDGSIDRASFLQLLQGSWQGEPVSVPHYHDTRRVDAALASLKDKGTAFALHGSSPSTSSSLSCPAPSLAAVGSPMGRIADVAAASRHSADHDIVIVADVVTVQYDAAKNEVCLLVSASDPSRGESIVQALRAAIATVHANIMSLPLQPKTASTASASSLPADVSVTAALCSTGLAADALLASCVDEAFAALRYQQGLLGDAEALASVWRRLQQDASRVEAQRKRLASAVAVGRHDSSSGSRSSLLVEEAQQVWLDEAEFRAQLAHREAGFAGRQRAREALTDTVAATAMSIKQRNAGMNAV